MKKMQDTNQMSVVLAAQLFLTHFLMGIMAIFLFHVLNWTYNPVPPAIFAATIVGMVGLVLNLNLQRSLRLLDWTLLRLIGLLPVSAVLTAGHGPLSGIMAKIQVLAERQRPFADLHQRQLHQVSEAAAQETRNRLARDLHDSIKQQLFSINISTAAAQARLASDKRGAQAALDDVRDSTKAALIEMNALLQQLSPEPLAKVGLVQALQEQCAALGYRTGAAVTLELGELPTDEQFLPGAQETIFRIAQEALSNIARHARAEQAWLHLGMEKAAVDTSPHLLLEIRDDGQGFVETAVSPGMGLTNIRQRVQEINGTLTLNTEPGQGTTLRLVLPLMTYMTDAKEQEMYQLDHTLNRFGLTGLGGGIALAALLFYPLYVLLPGTHITGWLNGSSLTGVLLALLAVPTTAAIGYTGARQLPLYTRAKRILAGAIAGGIAAMIFFLLLGNPAAILQGSDALLQHGYAPTQTESEMLYYLVETINGISWTVSSGFWLTLLAGIGLGAMGGALTPTTVSKEENQWAALRVLLPFLALSAQLASLMGLVIAMSIFTLLGDEVITTADQVAGAGFVLTHPVTTASVWPIWTTFIIYLICTASTILSFWVNRHALDIRQRTDYLLTNYVAAGSTTMLPLLAFTIDARFKGGLFFVGILINLLFGLCLTWQAQQLGRFAPATWETGTRTAEMVFGGMILLSFALALWTTSQAALIVLVLGSLIFLAMYRRNFFPSPETKIAHIRRRLPQSIAMMVCSILTLILPLTSLLSLLLGLTLIAVPAIAPLSRTPDAVDTAVTATLIEQIEIMYRLHPMALAVMLTLPAIATGLLILLIKLVSMWQARRIQA